MEPQDLLDRFDVVAGSTAGVAELRRLVVHLAVRGQLAEQRDTESSVGYVDALEVARSRLEDAGRFRRTKRLERPDPAEWPYEVPKSWSWVRLADVAWPQAGFAFKSKEFNEVGAGLPLIRIRDIGSDSTQAFFEGEYREEFLVEPGETLIGMDGNFNVRQWRGPVGLLNQRVTRLIFFGEGTVPRFVAAALQERLDELHGVKAYTTVQHLSGKQISASLIPLPPPEEQVRIMSAMDDCMEICDALERRLHEQEEFRSKFRQSALASLVVAEGDAVSPAWERVQENWEAIAGDVGAVDQLRSAVLRLGLAGELTNRRLGEPNANDLLSDIERHRAEDISAKLLRAQPDRALPAQPDSLPEGWLCLSLGHVFDLEYGKSLPAKDRVASGDIPVFGSNGVVGWHDEPMVSQPVVVVGRKGSAGEVNVANGPSWPIDTTYFVRPRGGIGVGFTELLLRGAGLTELDRSTAVPGLNREDAYLQEVWLPPLAEQEAIVEKVDALLRLCDELELALRARDEYQEVLARTMAGTAH